MLIILAHFVRKISPEIIVINYDRACKGWIALTGFLNCEKSNWPMSRMCTPCPKTVRDQKTCCMEKGRVSPIIWHFLSKILLNKILLNKIYGTSAIKASRCAIRSQTLAVRLSLGRWKFKAKSACLVFVRLFECVYLSVSLCLFPLSNFSDLFCFIYSFSGPNRGHYITIVKSHGLWLLFDDDIVEVSVLVVLKYL